MDLFIFGLNLKSIQMSQLKEGKDQSITTALCIAETGKD